MIKTELDRNIQKHIKYIIKNVFGKRGLKFLKLEYFSHRVTSNIFNFHGFLFSFFISKDLKNHKYKISILIYDSNFECRLGDFSHNVYVRSKWNFENIIEKSSPSERILAISYEFFKFDDFYKNIKKLITEFSYNLNIKVKNSQIVTDDVVFDFWSMSHLNIDETIQSIKEYQKLNLKNSKLYFHE